MSSCPNINSKEWKDLTAAVGEFEAMRDFMEYDTIRPVRDVLTKLNPLLAELEENTIESIYRPYIDYKKITVKTKNNPEFKKVLEKFNIKQSKSHFYYVMTIEQEERAKNWLKSALKNKDPKKRELGSTNIGFDLESREKETKNWEDGEITLKIINGITYLLIEDQDKVLDELDGIKFYRYPVTGFYMLPIQLVGAKEEKSYIDAEKNSTLYIPFLQKQINKYLIKTKGITAAKSANFYLLQAKNLVKDIIHTYTGDTISYDSLKNLTLEDAKNILNNNLLKSALENHKEKIKNFINSLDRDKLIKETLDLYASIYTPNELKELEKLLNYLPENFVRLLTFNLGSPGQAYFTDSHKKNIEFKIKHQTLDSKTQDFIESREQFSLNLAIKHMKDDGLISESQIQSVNDILRPLYAQYFNILNNKTLKPEEARVLAESFKKQFISKSKLLKNISPEIADALTEYRVAASNLIYLEARSQNAGLMALLSVLKSFSINLDNVLSNIALSDFSSYNGPRKFPIDNITIALHELGHALDRYLFSSKKSERDKILLFIEKLINQNEFQDYLKKGLYSRGYDTSYKKELTADLFAYLVGKAIGTDFTKSHLQSLDEFFKNNEVLVELMFSEVFDNVPRFNKTEGTTSKYIVPQKYYSIVELIKDLLNELIEYINKFIGADIFKPIKNKEGLKTVLTKSEEQTFISALDYIRDQVLDAQNFDIDNIINSKNTKYIWDTNPTGVSTTLENYALENPQVVNEAQQKTTIGNKILNEIVDRLSQNLGVKAIFITEKDAEAMLKEAGLPYDGEAGFFYNGQVYLVIERATTETAFHEFAHPFLRALSQNNPELFDKLYEELASTDEGRAIIAFVKSNYPELLESSPLFREEVLAHALARKANNQEIGAQESNGFTNFIKNLIFAIRQMFRKLFSGKISIEKLNAATTLEELANLLRTEEFNIDTKIITQEDIVSFARANRDEILNDLSKIEQSTLNQISKKLFKLAKTQSGFIRTKNYKDISEVLRDKMERADLTEILSNLRLFQTEGERMFASPEEEEKFMNAHAEAVLNSIMRFNMASKRILEHFKKITENLDSKEALLKAYYLNRVIKDWTNFVNEIKDFLVEEGGFKSGNPLFDILNEIKDNIAQSEKYTDRIYKAGTNDLLMAELAPLNTKINEHYENLIRILRERGASQEIINYYQREWDAVKITPERMKGLLEGELGDSNPLNSYLEGYMYNQDPVILGFGSYVKNRFVEMSSAFQQRYNKFIYEVEPLLKKAGYTSAYDRMKLGEEFLYLDVRKRGETGEPIESVWTFINPYKNWEGKLDELERILEEKKEALNNTNTDEAKTEYYLAIQALAQFNAEYMHLPYTDIYYLAQNVFNDEIGQKAQKAMQEILAKIRGLNSNITTPDEILENLESAKMYWREYRQLSSLYYPDGSAKPEESEDYKIAVKIREYKDKTRKFYEWKPRKGAFQNAYLNFIQMLLDSGLKQTDKEFQLKVAEWKKNNTQVRLNDKFYEDRAKIFQELAELGDGDPIQERILEIYKNINNLMSPYRDNNNHPIGSEMTQEMLSRIKSLELELDRLFKEEPKSSGLTKQERNFYNKYKEAVIAFRDGVGPQPSVEDTLMYNNLRNRLRTDNKVTEEQLTRIERKNELFTKLRDLQKRIPTTDYIDTINDFISNSPEALAYLKKELNQSFFSPADVSLLYQPHHLNFFFESIPGFKQWFNNNHIRKEYFKRKKKVITYTPTRAWTAIAPNDPKYYEETVIKDENDNIIDTIRGIPTLNYQYKEIKDSFIDDNGNVVQLKTPRITMLEAIRNGQPLESATIDNKGRWLPKMNAVDREFINEDYFKMQRENPDKFNLLMKLIETHLEIQEGNPYDSRLGLEAPRYRKSQYELVGARSLKENVKSSKLGTFWKNLRALWMKSADDLELGLNPEERELVTKADLFDPDYVKIPITGMYKLYPDEVSMDLLTSMSRYMQSGFKQRSLIDMLPTAKAIQKIVQTPPSDLQNNMSVGRNLNFATRLVSSITDHKSSSISKKSNYRAMAINAFIEREFEGKNQAGWAHNSPVLQKLTDNLLGMSSKMFFAFNIPSALKNSWGTRFQSMIEASGGEHFNWTDYGRGSVWAGSAMIEITAQVYSFGPKSLKYQLVELMDPSQGRFFSKISEGAGISRTGARDLADLTFMTNIRKWTELNSTLSAFGALLTKEMVDITKDGVTSKIPYSEAWEVVDGVIKLKDGINQAYAPGGEKFAAFVKKTHGIMNRMTGAYAQFEDPMAARYLLYRMIMFLKKYFVNMFMNRWQFRTHKGKIVPRYDGNMETVTMGYYIQFFKAIKNLLMMYKGNFRFLTDVEKAASRKTLTELGGLVLIQQLVIGLLYGYDDDDEDRFEKLRQKSGALPYLFVAEDPEHPFQAGGWFSNHLLNLAVQVESENDSWLPLPGWGLNDYGNIIKMESIAMTATIDRWISLVTQFTNYLDYVLTEDTDALYKRDVGPYEWQQQGAAKFLNHLAKSFTFTGTSVDPILAIKNLESRENR